MKLAWFTPLDRKSAIAECSRVIAEELARHCEIDVWTADSGDLLEIGTSIVRFHPRSNVLGRLQDYDHCVYNMGNFHPFHAAIYEVLKKHPGVVVMHDFIMHHFFVAEYLHEKRAPQLYVAEMQRSYGVAGGDLARHSVSDHRTAIWLRDEVIRFPLFEGIVDKASGVFVHSEFHRERVRNVYLGEVGAAYLPYRAAPVTLRREDLYREFGIPADKVVAVSTGNIQGFKRIEEVLVAIGGNPRLAERLVYVIIGDGPPEYLSRLQAMVAEFGIVGSVRFLGYQSADVLKGFLAAADFAINLRYPNSEGCSLSLIEQMSFGNPVVAISSGMYQEMPNTAVLKIASSDKGQELARAIEYMTFNEAARLQMGCESEAFARANFTAKSYTEKLLDYLSARQKRSYSAAHRSLHDVSNALSAARFQIELGTLAIEPILREFHSIVNGSETIPPSSAPARLSTLGVWVGFEHKMSLHDEEVTRLLCSLTRYLIERHDIDCEIWCYSFNEPLVNESFKSLLADPRFLAKFRVIHEENCVDALSSLSSYDRAPEVNVEKNNLYELANEFSNADCFLLATDSLDNALPLARPVFVPRYDSDVLESYQTVNEDFRPYARKVRETLEQFNRRGAFFICNGDHVKRQLMKHVRHLKEERIAVVYMPADIPSDAHSRLPTEAEIPNLDSGRSDRASLVLQQRGVKEAPFGYQWSDAADAYFNVMNDRLQLSAPDGSAATGKRLYAVQ